MLPEKADVIKEDRVPNLAKVVEDRLLGTEVSTTYGRERLPVSRKIGDNFETRTTSHGVHSSNGCYNVGYTQAQQHWYEYGVAAFAKTKARNNTAATNAASGVRRPHTKTKKITALPFVAKNSAYIWCIRSGTCRDCEEMTNVNMDLCQPCIMNRAANRNYY